MIEDKEILEGNKLIANFIGCEIRNDLYHFYIPPSADICNRYLGKEGIESMFYNFIEDELEYHLSWDWLMPVVTKLLKEGWVTVFYGNMCNITDIKSFTKQEENDLPFFETHSLNNETLIEAVWLSVVDCIKWNNEYGR